MNSHCDCWCYCRRKGLCLENGVWVVGFRVSMNGAIFGRPFNFWKIAWTFYLLLGGNNLLNEKVVACRRRRQLSRVLRGSGFGSPTQDNWAYHPISGVGELVPILYGKDTALTSLLLSTESHCMAKFTFELPPWHPAEVEIVAHSKKGFSFAVLYHFILYLAYAMTCGGHPVRQFRVLPFLDKPGINSSISGRPFILYPLLDNSTKTSYGLVGYKTLKRGDIRGS